MICKGLPKSTCLVLCRKIRSDWGQHVTFYITGCSSEYFREIACGKSALERLINNSEVASLSARISMPGRAQPFQGLFML